MLQCPRVPSKFWPHTQPAASLFRSDALPFDNNPPIPHSPPTILSFQGFSHQSHPFAHPFNSIHSKSTFPHSYLFTPPLLILP